MLKEAVTQFPAPWLAGCALGLFLFAMVVIWIRTFSRSQSETHARLANLPLSED